MNDSASGSVLVTGGAGFIGAHLVRALHDRGMQVRVIDDLSSGDPASLPPDVELVVADVGDPGIVDLVARLRPSRVVHAAAQVSVARSMADPDRDRTVNLVGTAHVLEGARRGGAKRFVFLSSGGAIYGEAAGVDESAPPAPASYYGVHKYAAERYVSLAAIQYAIARPSNVYGPGQRSDLEGGVVAIFCHRLAAGQPVTVFGSGLQCRDFVSVFDVVSGLLLMLDDGPSGTWNVSSGIETTIVELLHELERLLGTTAVVDWQPARTGEVVRSSLVTDRLRRDLGWRPRRSLRDGLHEVLSAPVVRPG